MTTEQEYHCITCGRGVVVTREQLLSWFTRYRFTYDNKGFLMDMEEVEVDDPTWPNCIKCAACSDTGRVKCFNDLSEKSDNQDNFVPSE